MHPESLKHLKHHWADLIREGQALSFHEGQSLYYEGHSPYGLFVLLSGKTHFQSNGSCKQEHGWKAPLGKVLGFESFFEDAPYCCSCIAENDCKVVFISKTQLLPFHQS